MSSEYGDKIHHVIISIGGSKRIFQIINELSAQTLQLGKVAATLPGRLEKSNEEHHLIINAIKAHDRELAGKLMEEHILSTQKDMLLALKNSHL
jgi:DNA-binding GntR family transcriptional regulator